MCKKMVGRMEELRDSCERENFVFLKKCEACTWDYAWETKLLLFIYLYLFFPFLVIGRQFGYESLPFSCF
jgi:hypothetical protein